jgi:spore coat polysaccharide biosynthesis protein SpsF
LKTIATIEARMTSTRLPGKVLAKIGTFPALALMVKRVSRVPEIDDIVIATTTNATDDEVVYLARQLGVGVWRGSEEDVLQRVLDAARNAGADVIVELTGDCPLIDPAIVSKVINRYRELEVDYVSNGLMRSYPIGMDLHVFSTDVLADVNQRTNDAVDHEHVSLFIYRHPEIYSLANVEAPPEEMRPNLRLTLDTVEDLEVIRAIHHAIGFDRFDYSLANILKFLDANPQIAAINAAVLHRWV